MIRYRIKELIADWQFAKGRTLSISELAETTGIARRVLNSMVNEKGYNANISNIDRLCRFFACEVSAVITYIPDDQSVTEPKLKKMGPRSTKK